MRHRLGSCLSRQLIALAAVVGMLMIWANGAAAQTASSFDESLSPYGTWVDDPQYGRVWRPGDVPAGWRPYTYGRWVYTREYGWVWVSEEPWGWVAYHYGYWVWTSRYGWVWVAGDVWAPAWVEWCYADGYVGWTPMPPDPYWPGGYYYGSFDCASPRTYSRTVFVAEASFTAPRISAQVIAAPQVAVFARGAANVTKYSRTGGVIANSSIDLAKLQAAVGQPIRPVRVIQATSPAAVSTGAGPLRELRIFKPAVTALKPPRLDAGSTLKTDLEPKDAGALTPAPLETGTLSRLPTDRSVDGPSLPPLGGRTIGGGLGGGGLGGGGIRLGR